MEMMIEIKPKVNDGIMVKPLDEMVITLVEELVIIVTGLGSGVTVTVELVTPLALVTHWPLFEPINVHVVVDTPLAVTDS